MNSAMPNRPSASATISTPSNKFGMPKVKRGVPVSMSLPMMPIKRPQMVMATPLSGEPRASVEPANRPSNISEQISAGPNFKASTTRSADRKIISVMPQEAPPNEPMTVMPSAAPPRPFLVSGKPSKQVTAWGG